MLRDCFFFVCVHLFLSIFEAKLTLSCFSMTSKNIHTPFEPFGVDEKDAFMWMFLLSTCLSPCFDLLIVDKSHTPEICVKR